MLDIEEGPAGRTENIMPTIAAQREYANRTLGIYPRVSGESGIRTFRDQSRRPRNSGLLARYGTPRRVLLRVLAGIRLPRGGLPFLRLATPRATSPVTFHVSAVTPVTAAGNTIRLVIAVVVVVELVPQARRYHPRLCPAETRITQDGDDRMESRRGTVWSEGGERRANLSLV